MQFNTTTFSNVLDLIDAINELSARSVPEFDPEYQELEREFAEMRFNDRSVA